MRTNLTKVYTYNSVKDSHLTNVDEILSLFQNYRYSYFKLISYYTDQGLKDKARELLSSMNKTLPENLVPFTGDELKTWMNELSEKL